MQIVPLSPKPAPEPPPPLLGPEGVVELIGAMSVLIDAVQCVAAEVERINARVQDLTRVVLSQQQRVDAATALLLKMADAKPEARQ